MNILKSLQAIRTNNRNVTKKDVSEELLSEVKELLNNNNTEENSILRRLNMDNHLRVVEGSLTQLVKLEDFEEKYGEVFTTSEIREVCLDYRLRFLNVTYFNGNISNDLPSAILRFCKENNISMDKNMDRKFFIVAPAKSFKLQKKPVDPLLFYKVGEADGENVYKLVHMWGKDFTATRLVVGFLTRNLTTFLISCFFIAGSILGTVIPLLGGSFIAGFTLGGLIGSIVLFFLVGMSFEETLTFSDECWKSDVE